MDKTIDEIEDQCVINLDWFYHATRYKESVYKNILEEGIKCNYLLNKTSVGRFNGPFYISLSKITIPDNNCFIYYSCNDTPSIIVKDIEPIKCRDIKEYEKYIYTKDKRRMGNFDDEYQQYYLINNHCIEGILYNLYDYINYSQEVMKVIYLKELYNLLTLLEKLNLDIPIYDYSRRNKIYAHKINKEKIKYYRKELL